MQRLGLHPEEVDIVAVSEGHADHTGSVLALPESNAAVDVCVVKSFSRAFKTRIVSYGAKAFKPPPRGGAVTRIIDVGAGAGIPGVPIKILFPNIRLVLLEATAKKATFLRHLEQKLRLDKVEIVVGWAEEVAHLSEYREGFDIVLSRAVAPLPTLAELTLPFCAIGGSFIAQKKDNIELEVSQPMKAISRR